MSPDPEPSPRLPPAAAGAGTQGTRGRFSARAWRLVAGTAAGILVTVALLVTALRIALAYVPQNEQKLRTWIERQTQVKLEYSRLGARLRWYGPEIVLDDLRVLDADRSQTLFATRSGSIGLDLWSFLRTGQFVAGRVLIREPRITLVRLPDGRIRLLGLRERPADHPPFDFDRLPGGRVVVEDAVVVYRDLKSGRAPLELTGLDLQVRRSHDFVLMEGSATLPAELGTRAGFGVRLKGSLDEREHLDARVEIDADTVRLPGLDDFLPAGLARPIGGEGPMRAALVLRQGQLADARLEFRLREVALRLPARVLPPIETVRISAPRLELTPGNAIRGPTVTKEMLQLAPPPLPLEARFGALEGELGLRREGGGWTFRAERLRLQPGARRAATETVAWGTWSGASARAFAAEINVDGLDLGAAWPLLLAFAPPSLDRFAGLSPSGRVEKLRAVARRSDGDDRPTFTIEVSLASLGVKPHGRFPGLSGVSLELAGDDRAGTVQLRATQPAFEWPRMFSEPLTADSVVADGGWRREGAVWTLFASSAQLDHPRGQARVDFEFAFERPDISPVLRLDAQVPRVDVATVPRFIPVGRLRERTIAWLLRAFVDGTGTNGRLSYRGPVRKFPFRDGEGDFLATVDASDVTLDYYPGFAPLRQGTGKATFHNESIEATLTAGEIGGLRLVQTGFRMSDYKTPVLQIDGQATGDLGQALGYLQSSPLGPVIGGQFMSLAGQGPARYSVQLTLPVVSAEDRARLTTPLPARDYAVQARLDGVSVAWPALRAPAQRVQGTFDLHNYDVTLTGLRGTILDGPFELSATPARATNEVEAAIELTAKGRAGGARLPAFIGLPPAIVMGGATDWELRGRLEKTRVAGAAWPMQFEVTSNLAGLEIKAPRPFAKAAAEVRPTRVRLEMPATRGTDVMLDSGSARARLRFAVRDGLWRLDRGAARFDGQAVSMPAQPGLLVAGDWPNFDLGEWLALSSTTSGASATFGGRRLMDWLGPVDVHLERATVFGFEFADVFAKLRAEGGLWRIAVTGPQATGQVTVPDDLGRGHPIALDMQHLQLVTEAVAPGAAPASTRYNSVDPRTLPGITAQVEDFSWQARRFGRLVAAISRDPRGLTFDSIATTAPSFDIAARGSWWMEQDGSRTRLQANFHSTDFAAAARSLAYRDAIDATKARVNADLWWSGGPSLEAVKSMNGTLRVALEDGRLRDIEPGAGRMLGLLSVAQLPRRLSLDFRDVTEQGLAFNSIRGDFELKAGNAFTSNLLLKGPAIDMGIAGRTGLAAEDYDQTIVVSGNPSGPLAVAGALAAGPVIGAGVLVLSQLFKDQLQGLTRAYYHVSGPWAAPVVQRISGPVTDEAAAGPADKQQGAEQ